MELRQLQTFVCVAQIGSFTRASDELMLTQPAVSRQIASLEQELKTRLFDRLGKRVQLTGAGQALIAYAVDILRLAADAARAVEDETTGAMGRIALGASSTAAAYLLPPLLHRFRYKRPGVELSVRTGSSVVVAELVLANSVDVGLVMDFLGNPQITRVELASYSSVVVAPPGHPLAQFSDGVLLSQLAGVPLILMQVGTTLRKFVHDIFNASGLEASVSMELDNVEAIKKMVAAGLGISVLPRLAALSEVNAGLLTALPIIGVDTSRSISAIYRRDKYLSRSLQVLLDVLRAGMVQQVGAL